MATAAQAPHPAPSVPEMLALSDIPAKLDPAHPLRIGEEYYPLESRRLGEEGSCVIRLQVDSDGYIRATELASSTGFERLNEACLASASNGRLIPATVGGKPATSWFFLRVNWKLTGSTLALRPHVRDDYHLKVGPEYYPPISRKLHQEGDCVVHVTVDEDGPPSTVTIAKSAGYAPLDEACLSAVREAQFTAARVGGVRTQSSTDIGISWRLHDP
jgi:TonB family protein